MCLADLHGRQLIQALAALGLLACGLDTKAQTPAAPGADTGTPAPTVSSKSAQSPYFCVDPSDPTFRFVAENHGLLANVSVAVVYQGPLGPVALPVLRPARRLGSAVESRTGGQVQTARLIGC